MHGSTPHGTREIPESPGGSRGRNPSHSPPGAAIYTFSKTRPLKADDETVESLSDADWTARFEESYPGSIYVIVPPDSTPVLKDLQQRLLNAGRLTCVVLEETPEAPCLEPRLPDGLETACDVPFRAIKNARLASPAAIDAGTGRTEIKQALETMSVGRDVEEAAKVVRELLFGGAGKTSRGQRNPRECPSLMGLDLVASLHQTRAASRPRLASTNRSTSAPVTRAPRPHGARRPWQAGLPRNPESARPSGGWPTSL